MHVLLVKTLDQRQLVGRADTPWRAPAQRPEWRSLYKTPLTRRGGDLQWRILHGAVDVNTFVSWLPLLHAQRDGAPRHRKRNASC